MYINMKKQQYEEYEGIYKGYVSNLADFIIMLDDEDIYVASKNKIRALPCITTKMRVRVIAIDYTKT